MVDIVLKAKSAYKDGMVDWQESIYQSHGPTCPQRDEPSDYITSLEITARKPTASQTTAPPQRASRPRPRAGSKPEVEPSRGTSSLFHPRSMSWWRWAPHSRQLRALASNITTGSQQLGVSKEDMARAVEIGSQGEGFTASGDSETGGPSKPERRSANQQTSRMPAAAQRSE